MVGKAILVVSIASLVGVELGSIVVVIVGTVVEY